MMISQHTAQRQTTTQSKDYTCMQVQHKREREKRGVRKEQGERGGGVVGPSPLGERNSRPRLHNIKHTPQRESARG